MSLLLGLDAENSARGTTLKFREARVIPFPHSVEVASSEAHQSMGKQGMLREVKSKSQAKMIPQGNSSLWGTICQSILRRKEDLMCNQVHRNRANCLWFLMLKEGRKWQKFPAVGLLKQKICDLNPWISIASDSDYVLQKFRAKIVRFLRKFLATWPCKGKVRSGLRWLVFRDPPACLKGLRCPGRGRPCIAASSESSES